MLAFAWPACAEVAPQNPAALTEVIVTARWREERLQDAPVSITVFSEADLRARGLTNLAQIAAFTPNLVFDPGVGDTGGSTNAQIYIRGVGQADYLFTTEPGVGVYVDGVYAARSIGSMMNLIDVEQIEVLKGPQGTAFGKNSAGGAINIVTRRPGREKGGRAAITLGSDGRRDGFAAIDLPTANGRLASKVALNVSRRDGYVTRLDGGAALGGLDAAGAALQVRWSPDEAFELLVATDVSRRRETPSPTVLLAVDTAAPLLALWNGLVAAPAGAIYDGRFARPDAAETYATGENRSDLDLWGVSATAEWRGDFGRLRSISAFRRHDADFATDADHSPLAYTEQAVNDRMQQTSQELRWLGATDDGRLKYMLGGLLFSESGRDTYSLQIAPGLFNALEALPPGIIPGLGGAGNPIHRDLDYDAVLDSAMESFSSALFAQADYELNDAMSLSTGLRQTWDRKSYWARFERLSSGVTVYDVTAKRRWSALTPSVSLQHRWTPRVTTYVSAARGYKAGGVNGRAQTAAGATRTFNPEYVWTYETGLKSAWFDDRARVNLALFHSDYKDLQLLSFNSQGGAPVVVVENAGAATVDGFELEITARPTNASRLNLGLGHLDARYTRLDPSVTAVTLKSRLAKTPAWTLNLGLEHDLRTALGRLTVRGDYVWRSRVENSAENSPALAQTGFGLLNAQATLHPLGAAWSLTLSGANLTGARYITNGLDTLASIGVADATLGRPREWAMRLDYGF